MFTVSSCSVGHGELQRQLISFKEVPDCDLWGWRKWRMVNYLLRPYYILCSLCSVY